jgi:hypothetical protein
MSGYLKNLFTNQAATTHTTPLKDYDEDTVLGYVDNVYKKFNLKVCKKCYATVELANYRRYRPDGIAEGIPICPLKCDV